MFFLTTVYCFNILVAGTFCLFYFSISITASVSFCCIDLCHLLSLLSFMTMKCSGTCFTNYTIIIAIRDPHTTVLFASLSFFSFFFLLKLSGSCTPWDPQNPILTERFNILPTLSLLKFYETNRLNTVNMQIILNMVKIILAIFIS